ncbi:hypothetical protein BDN70DRAFT_873759 [Pholiota conissans]|uniref:Uncharacterized protein n=1 Tax=Pholiota conissans TaxID=109636 RepID=A0A9P5Z9T3_9AGAR|nr:hypothetical protein BDN70DRAFT_873759 [Pholiota conissans]
MYTVYENPHHLLPSSVLGELNISFYDSGADYIASQDKFWSNRDLPLFALLVSVFSIDQSTADLLTSRTPQSFLSSGSNTMYTEDTFDGKHSLCIHDKLTSRPRNPFARVDVQDFKSLRDGLNAVVEYQSDTSPLLTASMNLYDIFSDLVADRVRAIRV